MLNVVEEVSTAELESLAGGSGWIVLMDDSGLELASRASCGLVDFEDHEGIHRTITRTVTFTVSVPVEGVTVHVEADGLVLHERYNLFLNVGDSIEVGPHWVVG